MYALCEGQLIKYQVDLREFHEIIFTTIRTTCRGSEQSSTKNVFQVHFEVKWSIWPQHLLLLCHFAMTRNPAIAEGPRDAGVPVEIW